jgi:hypothetical protein
MMLSEYSVGGLKGPVGRCTRTDWVYFRRLCLFRHGERESRDGEKKRGFEFSFELRDGFIQKFAIIGGQE